MKLNDEERKKLLEYAEESNSIAKLLQTAIQLSEKGSRMVPSFVADSFSRSAKLSCKISEFCRDNIPSKRPMIVSSSGKRLVDIANGIRKQPKVIREIVVGLNPIPYDAEGEEHA